MCGIAGQIRADRGTVDARLMSDMGESLRHRGPDDCDVYVQGHVGLAHRRLSILDLTSAGRQPMWNEDGSACLVLNGEIYNYEELRRTLRKPRAFRSRTDTEVLLYLYEDFGIDCVPMLRGMFAFAIWDARAQRLILARDRLGKKPLFYAVDDHGLTFASELKSLLKAGCRTELDPVAIHHYLTFQYVPTPLTIFRGVRKLPPGHLLTYADGKASESKYWALSYAKGPETRSDREYQEEFEALLKESVRLRLVSDVPLGAFLSGGLDSSAVAAEMTGAMDQPVQTFSVGFNDTSLNELPFARQVAAHLGAEHHELLVEPDAVAVLPALVRVYDEPFGDSSAIPTYYLARFARQFVTVALNGDGGDELLGGYPRYSLTLWDSLTARNHSMRNKDRLRTLLGGALWARSASDRVLGTLDRLLAPLSLTYLGRISYFTPAEKERLYAPDFAAAVRGHDSYRLLEQWFEEVHASDALDLLLGVDTRSYLPDDLLVKMDRATMAHGLEVRSPLLDHKLVEFAAALPTHLKIRHHESKFLLKTVMRGRLPESVLQRPKQGFAVPIDRWFREEARDLVRDTLLSTRSIGRGYFDPAQLRRLLDAHQQEGERHGDRLYALLMLELWHREYADGGAS